MKGNEKDCICHKPKGKHTDYCDAFRWREFKLKCSSVLSNGGKLIKEVNPNDQ